MLVENPLSDYLGKKKIFVESARIFAYGLQFTYLTMPRFFRQFALRFRENRSQNFEESLNGVQ